MRNKVTTFSLSFISVGSMYMYIDISFFPFFFLVIVNKPGILREKMGRFWNQGVPRFLPGMSAITTMIHDTMTVLLNNGQLSGD
jgi:hypothetical protein